VRWKRQYSSIIAVGDHGAQGEDGFGALESPSGSGDVEPVADKLAAYPARCRDPERELT
jgi:hypothetical protein